MAQQEKPRGEVHDKARGEGQANAAHARADNAADERAHANADAAADERAHAAADAAADERAHADRLAIDGLADELLPALIARFGASGLAELEVRQGPWRVRLKKPAQVTSTASPGAAGAAGSGAGGAAGVRGHAPTVGAPGAAGSPSGGRRATDGAGHGDAAAGHAARAGLAAVGPGRGDGAAPASGATGAGAATAGSGTERVRVVSPAVGYFTPLEAMRAGHPVRAGDPVGHIEVLGVRQPVTAPVDGVVARVLAQPGEAVEYGQELVRLEPLSARATAEEPA